MANNRERVLLALFLGALCIGGGLIGWRAFSGHLAAEKKRLAQKEVQLIEARRWLEEEETWLARESWLSENPPPPYAGPQTDAEFVRQTQASLAASQIEIVEQRIQETVSGSRFVEAGIDLTLTAPLENFVRWLHETQQVDSGRVIRRIKLKSDEADAKMKAEVSLMQLYEKPNAAPAASAPADEP